MKKAIIRLSFFGFIVVALTTISSCKKEKDLPPSGPSLVAANTNVMPYELAYISCENLSLTGNSFPATFESTAIQLMAHTDSFLYFMVPVVNPGAYQLKVSINNVPYTVNYNVLSPVSIPDPAQYISSYFSNISQTNVVLNERIDTLARQGMMDSNVEKGVFKRIDDSLAYYQQQILLLSPADQAKAAAMLAANLSPLNAMTNRLNPLIDNLSGQSFFKQNSTCSASERSERMRCLMNEFNALTENYKFIDKLNLMLAGLTLPVPGNPLILLDKLILKGLAFNSYRVEQGYYLVGFELASRPYHTESVDLTNPPTVFTNLQQKSITLNVTVRNAKRYPDATDKSWEKEFSKNFDNLITHWQSFAMNLISDVHRTFPLQIHPRLLPENTDAVLDVSNTNTNVISSSVLGTPQNMAVKFSTSQTSTQNFTYHITYDDGYFSAQTADVNASIVGIEPAALVYVSGNNQSGSANLALPNPLKVRVNDANGNGLQGVQVTFNITSGGGNLTNNVVTTNASGEAQTYWTLGAAGTQQVQATAKNGQQNNLNGSPFSFSASIGGSTVTDIDGNVYNTVQIGTQTWMQENLKTAHYRDGSAITEIEDSATWANIYNTSSQTPAWCYYGGNAANNATYGKLYNWYAVADPLNVCPTGWHVPTDAEFTQLTDYLGGDAVAGGKMKAVTLWQAPNTGADNSSGFTALPTGICYGGGGYGTIGTQVYFWSSTNFDTSNVWYRNLSYNSSGADHNRGHKTSGFSVRCVKD
jgi:uncharacterized protein (TIGR02145 family)